MKFVVFGAAVDVTEVASTFSIDGKIIGTIRRTDTTLVIHTNDLFSVKFGKLSLALGKGDLVINLNTPSQPTKLVTLSIGLPAEQIDITDSIPQLNAKNELLFIPTDSLQRQNLRKTFTNRLINQLSLADSHDEVVKYPNLSQEREIAGISVDATSKKFVFFYSPKTFLLEITYSINEFDLRQPLSLYKITTDLTSTIDFFYSLPDKTPFLYIQPDFLSFPKTDEAVASISCLLQFALINGLLRETIAFGQKSVSAYFWDTLPAFNQPAGVVVLRYVDSNSHPIVLTHPGFALSRREGLDNVSDRPRTIGGFSLAALENCRLQSLSHKSIDWNVREKILYNHFDEQEAATLFGNRLSKPFWYNPKNDVVLLQDRAPAEIFGTAKGTRITRKLATSAESVLVSIASDPIIDGTSPIYHRVTLQLNSQDWLVETAFEERETRVHANGTIPVQAVSRRQFASDKPIEIPAFDYVFGASNITSVETTAGVPVIPREITKWADSLNTNLQLAGVGGRSHKHISGFNRQMQADDQLKRLFDYPVFKAETLVITAPIAPTLRPNQVDFVHGPSKAADSQAAATATASPQRIIRKLTDQLALLWHDAAFLEEWLDEELKPIITDLKRVIYKIRDKVGGLRENFTIDIGDARIDAVLLEIKNLVQQNLAELKSLGSRIRKISDLILRLDARALQQLWQGSITIELNGVTIVLTLEEQKIIAALFDYYFKPFDKATLLEVARVILGPTLTVEEKTTIARALSLELKTLLLVCRFIVATKELALTNEEIIFLANQLGISEEEVSVLVQKLSDTEEFLSQVFQGADELLETTKDVWQQLDEFKNKYGPYLTLETYKRLLLEATKEELGKLEKVVKEKIREKFRDVIDKAVDQAIEELEPYEDHIWSFVFLVDSIVHQSKDIRAIFNQLKACVQLPDPLQRVECVLQVYNSDTFKPHRERLEALIEDDFRTLRRIIKEAGVPFETFVRAHQQEVDSIITFYFQAAQAYERINTSLEKIKSFSTCWDQAESTPAKIQCFLTAYRDLLTKEEQETLETYIGTLLREQYGIIRTSLEQTFDQFLLNHQEEVVTILQILTKIDTWRATIDNIKNQVNELKTVISLIKANDRTALVEFLLVKMGLTVRLADLRVEPPQYLVFGNAISSAIPPAQVQVYKNWLRKIFGERFKLCDLGNKKAWTFTLANDSIIVIKLGNEFTIGEILTQIEDSNRKDGIGPFGTRPGQLESLAKLTELIHPEISIREWRGIYVFNPVADVSADELLNDLCGRSQFKMIYAAVGGEKPPTFPNADLDIYARIQLDREAIPVDSAKAEEKEVALSLVKFDATIRNTVLTAGEVEFELLLRNLFGQQQEAKKIMIRGTLPSRAETTGTRDFEFSAWLPNPLQIDLEIAFLDSFILNGIKAARRNGESVLEIDAQLELRDFTDDELGSVLQTGEEIILNNLRIVIPKAVESIKMGLARLLRFDWPAVETLIRKPRTLNFFGIEVTPTGIGVIHKDPAVFDNLTQNGFWVVREPTMNSDSRYFIYFRLTVNFGKLPILGGGGNNGLILNGILGFTFDKGAIDGPFWLLYGVRGTDVVIDLFRFIVLEAKRLEVGKFKVGEETATGLYLEEAKLKILNWDVLGERGVLDFLFLHNDLDQVNPTTPKNAFLAHLSNEEGIGSDFFKVFWLLCTHNLTVKEAILNALLTPRSAEDFGRVLETTKIVNGDWSDSKAVHELTNIEFTDQESWLFGAGFSMAGILDACSVILHDQHFYGVMMASSQPWFELLFGTDKFSLSYMPGARRELDRFRTEFQLAGLNFFGDLKSGLVALEATPNRDFLFDFGFPWRTGNTYLWHRTFSLAQGIYETRFGFYFEKRTDITLNGDQTLSFAAGVALSYGYRVAAYSPFAWAEAGISVTAILTGKITFRLPERASTKELSKALHSIEVVGVIGIYAYARGGINYWILTAEIRAEVVAALAGRLLYIPNGNSSLTFDATLFVHFSASCCLKLGFFKVRIKISGTLSYGVQGRIALN